MALKIDIKVVIKGDGIVKQRSHKKILDLITSLALWLIVKSIRNFYLNFVYVNFYCNQYLEI